NRIVVKVDHSTYSLLGRVNNARVERAGVNMQANRAHIKLTRIDDSVHGVEGIHDAGMSEVHLDGVGRFKLAGLGLYVLMYAVEIFHLQAANWHSHPAILVAVVMHRTCLADLPADSN